MRFLGWVFVVLSGLTVFALVVRWVEIRPFDQHLEVHVQTGQIRNNLMDGCHWCGDQWNRVVRTKQPAPPVVEEEEDE